MKVSSREAASDDEVALAEVLWAALEVVVADAEGSKREDRKEERKSPPSEVSGEVSRVEEDVGSLTDDKADSVSSGASDQMDDGDLDAVDSGGSNRDVKKDERKSPASLVVDDGKTVCGREFSVCVAVVEDGSDAVGKMERDDETLVPPSTPVALGVAVDELVSSVSTGGGRDEACELALAKLELGCDEVIADGMVASFDATELDSLDVEDEACGLGVVGVASDDDVESGASEVSLEGDKLGGCLRWGI